jgi:hypothetical protein
MDGSTVYTKHACEAIHYSLSTLSSRETSPVITIIDINKV